MTQKEYFFIVWLSIPYNGTYQYLQKTLFIKSISMSIPVFILESGF